MTLPRLHSVRKEVRIRAGHMAYQQPAPYRSLRVQEAKERGEQGKLMPEPEKQKGYTLEPDDGRERRVVTGLEPARWIPRDAEEEVANGREEQAIEAALAQVSLE